MIFETEPRKGGLIAVAIKNFQKIAFPKFSNVRLDDGHLTIQVDYEDKSFTRQEIIDHFQDRELRMRTGLNDYPYKFQGFEDSSFKTFRITSGELKNWRDQTKAATNIRFTVPTENGEVIYGSNTHVNLELLKTLETACTALEYYKNNHRAEYQEAKSNEMPLQTNWRYALN